MSENNCTNKISGRERERRRQGRTCFLSLRQKFKIKSSTNFKCLFKVLQHVRKYLQNSVVHVNSIYYMFFYHYNGFKILTLLHGRVATNIFGSHLTQLALSSCFLLTIKFLFFLRYGQAFAHLFTSNLKRNAICFITVKEKYYRLSIENQFHCHLNAISDTLEAISTSFSPRSPKFPSNSRAVSDRFVRFYNVLLLTPNIRVRTLKEIRSALNAAGIESNPGPEQSAEPNPVSKLEIVTVNCNGLTCNVRLLQTVSRIKKLLRNKDCIIFLQETHNANLILLESVWEGSVHVSPGTGEVKELSLYVLAR